MPSRLENRTLIIRRLRDHLDEIEGFVHGLTPQQLVEQPAPGHWSIHEIILHLAEMQAAFVDSIARMLVERKPVITPPDCSTRDDGYYLQQSFAENYRGLKEQRLTLLYLLESLDEKQWELEGEFKGIRHYSVEKCMESLMRYEEKQLYNLFNVFFGIKE